MGAQGLPTTYIRMQIDAARFGRILALPHQVACHVTAATEFFFSLYQNFVSSRLRRLVGGKSTLYFAWRMAR